MSSAAQANDEEEEDYMSMTIVDPKPPAKETYTQRRLRKQREVCFILFHFEHLTLPCFVHPLAQLSRRNWNAFIS